MTDTDHRNASDSDPPIFFKGQDDIAKAINLWRTGGVWSAVKSVRDVIWGRYFRYTDRAFDRKYGVDTYAVSYPEDLTLRGNHSAVAHHYEPTFVRPFLDMLSELPTDLSDFVFVDYGSGKGKPLLLASRWNFSRIIGVEFAKELHTIAVQNIAAYKDDQQKCTDIVSVWADATMFELPKNALVIYFDNPFGPPVLNEVVWRLEESYRAVPRKIYVIYENPKFRDVFDSLDFLTVLDRKRFRLRLRIPSPYDFLIYESAD